MGKLYKDLPSIDLPCVCLRFYGLSYYHSFRLLYRTQTQQQLGCYSRAACMQGATAESLLLLQILSHLYWETLSSKKGLQYSDLWTVNADIRGKWVISRDEWSATSKYDGSLSLSTELPLLCLESYTNATITKDVWVCYKPAKMFPPQKR